MVTESGFEGFRTYVVDDWEYLMHYFEAGLAGSGTASEVADQFTAFVANQAVNEFEFFRCDAVPYRVTPGCLAGLLGAKESYGHHTMVTFRRQVKLQDSSPSLAVPAGVHLPQAVAAPPLAAPPFVASAPMAPAPTVPTPRPQDFEPPASDRGQANRTPLLVGGGLGLLALTVLVGALLSGRHKTQGELVATSGVPALQKSTAPTAAPSSFATVQVSPDWFLKGGEISGRFVPPEAQADWPEWMQALVAGRAGVPAAELTKADFYRIPDSCLAQAVGVLVQQRVFTPDLLRQISAISYAADTGGWLAARSDYQRAYLQANPLPTDDPATCSQVLTGLVRAKDYTTARKALQHVGGASDAEQRASWLRMLDLAESGAKPDLRIIGDPSLPPSERFTALMALGKKDEGAGLLGSFRDTPFFGEAVYLGVGRGWVRTADPLVDEAVAQDPPVKEDAPWFLVRPGERASDLLWMQAAEALANNQQERAAQLSQDLLKRFPQSYYAGHAIFLEEALGQVTPEAHPRLKVPSDLNLYNEARLPLQPPAAEGWPAPYDAMAARGRFDLILAQVDPRTQPKLFFMAAARSGQIDLVSRYLAMEKQCSTENLGYLYPTTLAPVVAQAIREEGLQDLLEPAFVLSVIKCESLFQPTASSSADAVGMMQLLKSTFTPLMGPSADIRDPLTNIHAGLKYFKKIIKIAGLEHAPAQVRYAYLLMGYHAGDSRAKAWFRQFEPKLGLSTQPKAVIQRIESVPIFSTRQYLVRVLGDYAVYSRLLSL